ncbi:hypothetical protein [Janibacter sp. GXQ6167]|uniref:hypothetical protein n=1 Tax=Janibacter sp. GXQ6167 TaxID=3240791 RepID=UPI0035236B15
MTAGQPRAQKDSSLPLIAGIIAGGTVLVALIAGVALVMMSRGGDQKVGGTTFERAVETMDWEAVSLNGRVSFRYVDLAQYRESFDVDQASDLDLGPTLLDLAMPNEVARSSGTCRADRDDLRAGLIPSATYSVVTLRAGIVAPGQELFDTVAASWTGGECGMTRSGDVVSGGEGPVPGPRVELTDDLFVSTQGAPRAPTFERGRGDLFGDTGASDLRPCIGERPLVVTLHAVPDSARAGVNVPDHVTAIALVTETKAKGEMSSRVCVATDGSVEAVKTALETKQPGRSKMTPTNIAVDGSVITADLQSGGEDQYGGDPQVVLHSAVPEATGFLF